MVKLATLACQQLSMQQQAVQGCFGFCCKCHDFRMTQTPCTSPSNTLDNRFCCWTCTLNFVDMMHVIVIAVTQASELFCCQSRAANHELPTTSRDRGECIGQIMWHDNGVDLALLGHSDACICTVTRHGLIDSAKCCVYGGMCNIRLKVLLS